MNTHDLTIGHTAPSGSHGETRSAMKRALDTVESALGAWHRRHVIQRTAAALRSLDDATLHDIGVDRAGIYEAAAAAYEESEETALVA